MPHPSNILVPEMFQSIELPAMLPRDETFLSGERFKQELHKQAGKWF